MIHILLIQAVLLQYPKYKPDVPIKGKVDFNKLGHSSKPVGMSTKGLTTTGSVIDSQYTGSVDEARTEKNKSSMSKKSKSSKSKLWI